MKTMKFFGAICLCAAVMMTASCSQDASDMEPETWNVKPETTEVVLTFTPYTMEGMTRSATSIVALVERLDVWLYESGAEAVAIHQAKGVDADFGTITATLDKTKTYTLYAVAHKAGAAATLADGVISWTGDEVTHSMYCTETFTPSETTSLTCEMARIVAQFRFETSDEKPEAVPKMRFTFSDVYDRWSVTTGATHGVNSTVTLTDISPKADGTLSLNLYVVTTDELTTHDVTVEALNSSNGVEQTRTFPDVPLRNGYRTTYHGTYFTDTPTTATFTVGSWNTYSTVEF